MKRAFERPTVWYLGMAAIGTLAMLLVLAGPTLSQAPGSQASRASGHLVWMGLHETRPHGGSDLLTQGEEAIITVRMERRGSEWVDAGSRFRGRYIGRYAPYPFYPCFILFQELFWLHVARFDEPDTATGFIPSTISLTLDPAAGTARLDARMSGGKMASSIGQEGPADNCQSGSTIVPWTADFSVGAHPTCPIAEGAARGRINSAGTRIDFRCHDRISGLLPNREQRYYDEVRLAGYLRLLP